MSYRGVDEVLAEASRRGLRRAFLVTAVMLEMDAVRGHLVQIGSVIGRDGAIYECGVFSDLGQDWLVVVAETGAGTHPAQSTVTYAHVLFGGFEVQIFVGIGGSRKADAPLGSVVASDQVYMPYSAKYGAAGRSSRPRTFQVDGKLVGIAKKVRRDREWSSRIRDPHGGKLPPFNAYPVGYPPIGLVAPIVSVEAVLADPGSELEALIADGYGDSHVVEMEGYGAIYAASQERTPSILVRGISDMTQDKSPERDAQLQPVAACHAAAFAFEVLSHWGQAYSASRPEAPETAALLADAVPGGSAGTSQAVGPEPASETPESVTEPSGLLAAQRSPLPADVVLNLDEAFPADLAARLSAIEGTLRALLGTDSITVTGGAKGSLRAFVSDPTGALRKLGSTALRSAIAERDGSCLLGMADMAEYENLQQVQSQLAQASADLMTWPTTLPDGESIDRPELEQLTGRIQDEVASTTAVLGAAGSGKSALLAALARRFVHRGWPVLAIKGDLLDADIASESDLQTRLGLDALPSVLLQRLARFQPVLLILDQLDALAGYLDLRTARLSILLSLVRRLGRTDNVYIVLSSRTFEFEHDVRLRAVSAEALHLQLPAWSEVLKLLEARGVRAAGWPPDAQEVMRSPQALATYLQLEGHQTSEPFASYQAMLDKLWEGRVLAGGGGTRGRLATTVAELMADEESLWLARARFDDRVEDVGVLEAAGVLTTLGGSLGFTHQTLFEYALARGFARKRGRLSGYVLERQTSLFLRPKLWAGLGYLRAVDVNAYHAELEAIWSAPGLRRHLRFLLIDLIGQQVRPTDREALLLERALCLPDERWPAFRALSGSPGWFTRFAQTFIADSMSESEESAGRMVGVLSRAWSFAADEVVQLLRERWLPKPGNDVRTWMVLQDVPRWTDGAVELLCTVAGRTDISPNLVDHLVGTVGVEQPEPALRLARARLDRQLVVARAEADELARKPMPVLDSLDERVAWSLTKDPSSPLRDLVNQRHGWESLPALAERSPSAFLDILWPWFENCFDALRAFATEREGFLGYALAYHADFKLEGGDEGGLPEPALLAGLRVAAEHLAGTDPDAWLVWADRLGALDIVPAQRLVAHGFAAYPGRYALPALAFLLGDVRRYMLGSLQDVTATSSALVAAASVHWPEEDLARFEAAVAAYRPAPPTDQTDPGERRTWARSVRRMKLALLRGLPRQRLTAEARRRVEEEERRFPGSAASSGFTEARHIGSMMQAGEIARASDEAVVNAFRTVPDASGWDHPRDWMVGGNIQLSREFATFAKDAPERAVRLLKALTPEIGTRAAGYALDALSEAAPAGLVLDVLRDAVGRGFDGQEFRASASRAIERLVGRKARIDDDIVLLLESWIAASWTAAPSAGGPGADLDDLDTMLGMASNRTKDREDSVHLSLLWGYGGLSVVPGGEYPILEALVHVRLDRGESDRLDRTLRTHLDHSRDFQVWDGLLRLLPHMHPGDAPRRAAFLDRLLGQVPALVGSKTAAHLLAQAHWWGPEFVNGQLDHWRRAAGRSARQGYGEIVAVVALTQPGLDWSQVRLEDVINDDVLADARAGAALTAANLWNSPKHRGASARLLNRLLAKGGQGVWTAAFDLFRITGELTPDLDTVSLLTTIAERLGEAPRLDATFVIDRLATLLPHQAMLVAHLVAGLIVGWRTELADIRTATAGAAAQLVDLAVTLHRLGPETREVGTALFEELVSIDVYAARQTLDELDNRFREQGRPPRPRLPRRAPPASRLAGRRPRA